MLKAAGWWSHSLKMQQAFLVLIWKKWKIQMPVGLTQPSPPIDGIEEKQEYTAPFVDLPGDWRSLDGLVLPAIKHCPHNTERRRRMAVAHTQVTAAPTAAGLLGRSSLCQCGCGAPECGLAPTSPWTSPCWSISSIFHKWKPAKDGYEVADWAVIQPSKGAS